MATAYPIIANCNYESAGEGEDARQIHRIRRAVDAGWTDDPALLDALGELEETLGKYAERSDQVAIEACQDAERAVLDAWTDEVAEAVEAVRRCRSRD